MKIYKVTKQVEEIELDVNEDLKAMMKKCLEKHLREKDKRYNNINKEELVRQLFFDMDFDSEFSFNLNDLKTLPGVTETMLNFTVEEAINTMHSSQWLACTACADLSDFDDLMNLKQSIDNKN